MRVVVDVDGELLPAEVEPTATVADVCGAVPAAAGRRLYHGDQELRNAEELAEAGVSAGAVLKAVVAPLPPELRERLEEICPGLCEEIEEGVDELYLNNTSVPGEEMADAVAEALPYSKWREVGLSFNEFGDKGIVILAGVLAGSRIETLNLFQTGITADGVIALAKVLPRSRVLELTIGGNTAGDKGGVAVARALPRCKVEVLQMVKSDLGDPAAKAFSEALEAKAALRDLSLSDNRISDDGLRVLASGIRRSQLVCLKLRSNLLGPDGIKALSEVLPGSQILELDLSDNAIGPSGAAALAAALKDGSELCDLILNSCQISDEGITALADALPSSSLQCLKVASNDISDDGAAYLSAVINRGSNEMTEVDLSENSISKAGTAALCRGFPKEIQLTV
eukprot:Hpha_TRINITY_DN14047_c0_g1::TRINITY_DN14047_c0_g1_i1::g.44167::m.44167